MFYATYLPTLNVMDSYMRLYVIDQVHMFGLICVCNEEMKMNFINHSESAGYSTHTVTGLLSE